jgi:SAM-dependent methyltransferase
VDDFVDYLSGRRLYGDDFDSGALQEWYEAEREGYASLGEAGVEKTYGYHAFNELAYAALPGGRLGDALGVGSALGQEFLPLVDRLSSLTVLEPSRALRSPRVGCLSPTYVDPDPSGAMPFGDQTFDLVVCLGVLHHIPNVSRVTHEIGRVLRNGGYAIIREPIVSLGDWRRPRRGLTANERGVPLGLMRKFLEDADLKVEREILAGFPLTRVIGRAIGMRDIFNSPTAVRLDTLAARVFRFNYRYHARKKWEKLRPTQACLVARR